MGKCMEDMLLFSTKDTDKNTCPVCLNCSKVTVRNAKANAKN